MARAAVTARSLSIEEWRALDEDVDGELVDGRLDEEETPTFLHEAIVSFILGMLRAWLVPRGGLVFGAEVN